MTVPDIMADAISTPMTMDDSKRQWASPRLTTNGHAAIKPEKRWTILRCFADGRRPSAFQSGYGLQIQVEHAAVKPVKGGQEDADQQAVDE